LRIDLGIMQHTEVTFLSDPDYPVHSLQVFWGATTMLAPDACLHWSFSEWLPGSFAERQTFNPRAPNLQPHQLDYYTRIAMLGALGFSQKLPELPQWVRERLAYHIRVYKEQVRRFVMNAELYHLTDQPRRDGSGERWCAFQYSLPAENLLFVFRLPGAEASRAIRLANLEADQLYEIVEMDGETVGSISGRELMEHGIAFNDLQEEESRLVRVFY
jgi:alpha-galactosidase